MKLDSNEQPPGAAHFVSRKAISRLALIATLVGVLSIAITACGGGGSDSGSTGGSTGASSSGSEPSESKEISGKIVIWSAEEYGKEAEEVLDANFEKMHPEVTIERVPQGSDYPTLLRTAFISGEVPDMVRVFPGAKEAIEFAKFLEPLNERITPDMEKNITGWSSATPGFTEDEGERVGVPQGLFGFTFYYNKALFKKAGLPAEFKPTSWAEIKEAAEKLEAAGIQPFVGGLNDVYEGTWWYSFGMQGAGTPDEALEVANGEVPYTSEIVTKALEPMIELKEFFPKKRYTNAFTDGFAEFAKGEGAMSIGFINTIGYWGEYNESLGEKNVGIFNAPEGGTVGTSASSVLAIPKGAKNADAAWALIEYEMSKEGMEILVEKSGYLPNRNDVELPADSPIQAKELVAETREKEVVPTPQSLLPLGVFEVVGLQSKELLQERMSLEEFQQAMQEAAEKQTTE